jgi:hypothetical protein
MVLPPEQPDFINVPNNSPLKIRGVRGVMEITPFIPLKIRGRSRRRTSFWHSGTCTLAFGFLLGNSQEIPQKYWERRGISAFPATNNMTKVIGYSHYKTHEKIWWS